MSRIGIIGGTGLNQMDEFNVTEEKVIDTPYGSPSCPVILGEWQGKKMAFLARHGQPHSILPHQINYRANIWALKACECEQIVAFNAVGGIYDEAESGDIVIPDQIIDYTYGRKQTFFDTDDTGVVHVDFTFPYTPALREQLICAARSIDMPIKSEGTYAAVQGPRLESAAEIVKFERDGNDIIGMTGMPEAVLAKEQDLHYACVAMVVNKAAGKAAGELTMKEMEAAFALSKDKAYAILKAFIESY